MLTRADTSFARAVAAGRCPADSARRAGYACPSEADAWDVAQRKLDTPEVREAIEAERERLAAAHQASADRAERKAFWSRVLRDEGNHLQLRLRASELLARAEGDFVERVEVIEAGAASRYASLSTEELLAVARRELAEQRAAKAASERRH